MLTVNPPNVLQNVSSPKTSLTPKILTSQTLQTGPQKGFYTSQSILPLKSLSCQACLIFHISVPALECLGRHSVEVVVAPCDIPIKTTHINRKSINPGTSWASD